jgi:hypothetical protein
MRQLPHRLPRWSVATCLPFAVALTTLAVMGWVQPTLAGDRKTYPGSACQS